MRDYDGFFDRLLIPIDTSLKSFFSEPSDTKKAASLMRVNHTGEVCAQALYRGQALVADSQALIEHLNQAADEEQAHLQWCADRLKELHSRASRLNPCFAAGSFGIGMIAGLCGEALSLGFVAETEKQVGLHLEKHLREMPKTDEKSRAILQQMQIDEQRHATQAIAHGAQPLPQIVCVLMKGLSKIMTTLTRYV
jgi:3-demethoxyubiquinol 3-hydroxylase